MVYDGHVSDPTVEGPKLYKRNKYYYIFAPAGGVSTGWQIVLRSKNIYGPYERKIVLHQGNTPVNGPHQGALINTQNGQNWFLHFQDKEAYGRIIHLQPVTWKNDWPVIGTDEDGDGKGEPTLSGETSLKVKGERFMLQSTDDFSSLKLSPQWQWQANPKEGWGFTTATGQYRMFSAYLADSVTTLWNYPGILAQKLPSEQFTATSKINFSPVHEQETFGLILFGSDYAYLSVRKSGKDIQVTCSENIEADKQGTEKVIASFTANSREIYFRLQMQKGGFYNFSFSDLGKDFITIGKTFLAKPGKWVGSKIGFFCIRRNITNNAGYADIDYIRFE